MRFSGFTSTLGLLYCVQSIWALRNFGNLFDDSQANPKFQVVFSDSLIPARDAAELLSDKTSPSNEKLNASPIDPAHRPRASNETTSEGSGNGDIRFEYIRVVRQASPHLCAIPQPGDDPITSTDRFTSRTDREKELAAATTKGWELMAPLTGRCLYYVEGWFSYSFCFDTGVRQFHHLPPNRQNPWPPLEDTNHAAYVLGLLDPPPSSDDGRDDQDVDLLVRKTSLQRDDSRVPKVVSVSDTALYLSQKLEYGTKCDLTGSPRTIEVQYHCAPKVPDERIGWIKETTTCNYQMAVYTTKLCTEPAFLPPKAEEVHLITCREIVEESEMSDWRARKAAEAEELLQQSKKTADQPRKIFIGGIEVGAMKYTGRSGEPLDIVPRKSPLVSELLARGAPFRSRVEVLPTKELEELKLDPKTVETLWQQLQTKAGERGWKLELVEDEDNKGGFKMRAVVDEPAHEVEIDVEKGAAKQDSVPSTGDNPSDEEKPGTEETYEDEL